MTQTSKSYSIPSAILSWSKLSLAFQIQKEGLSRYLSMVGVSKNLQPCFKAARVILVFSICVITTIVKENSEVWVVHFSPQSQGENIVRDSTFSWKFYIGIKCTKPNQMTTGLSFGLTKYYLSSMLQASLTPVLQNAFGRILCHHYHSV